MTVGISELIVVILLVVLFVKLLKKFKQSSSQTQSSKYLTYEDLLKTEEWKDKRDTILKRDDYKCRFCGKACNLQVHHKYYSRYPNGQLAYPWNYPDEALITLCNVCHKKVHKSKKIKTYYRKYSDNYWK